MMLSSKQIAHGDFLGGRLMAGAGESSKVVGRNMQIQITLQEQLKTRIARHQALPVLTCVSTMVVSPITIAVAVNRMQLLDVRHWGSGCVRSMRSNLL